MMCSFAEKAWLFKSHLMPAKLTFRTLDDQEYVVSDKLVMTLNRNMIVLLGWVVQSPIKLTQG